MKDFSAGDLGIEKKWFGEVAENCWDILCSKLCGKKCGRFMRQKPEILSGAKAQKYSGDMFW